MSYELENTREVPCKCGAGTIVETEWSNDWNQSKYNINLNCDECTKHYHIQHKYFNRSNKAFSIPYLVPLGESIYRNSSYNIYEIPFADQLCISLSLSDLQSIYINLCESTTYKKITDEKTRLVVRRTKSVLGTMRITTVRSCVSEAISQYNAVSNNFDKETDRVKEVLSKSFRIDGL